MTIQLFKNLAESRRVMNEAGYKCTYLLGRNQAAKTEGSVTYGYVVGMLYMEPSAVLCPTAEQAGCLAGCLKSAGRMAMSNAATAREERTRMFHNDFDLFQRVLATEVHALDAYATKLGLKPAVRLNGTSDVNWCAKFPELFEMFEDVQFYDYSKNFGYIKQSGNFQNLHISASYSESNLKYAGRIIEAAEQAGVNLVVVFRDKLPATFMGKPVIDGDAYDMRFLDDSGVVVGLKAKGKAKHDRSGFVIDPINFISTNIIKSVQID